MTREIRVDMAVMDSPVSKRRWPSWALGFYFYNGLLGWAHMTFDGGRSKILWHDEWIVEILALDRQDKESSVLLGEVIRAMSAHWRALGGKPAPDEVVLAIQGAKEVGRR